MAELSISMDSAMRSAWDRLHHALWPDELLFRGCPSAATEAEGRPAAASGFLVAPPNGARLEVAALEWLKSGRGSGFKSGSIAAFRLPWERRGKCGARGPASAKR